LVAPGKKTWGGKKRKNRLFWKAENQTKRAGVQEKTEPNGFGQKKGGGAGAEKNPKKRNSFTNVREKE